MSLVQLPQNQPRLNHAARRREARRHLQPINQPVPTIPPTDQHGSDQPIPLTKKVGQNHPKKRKKLGKGDVFAKLMNLVGSIKQPPQNNTNQNSQYQSTCEANNTIITTNTKFSTIEHPFHMNINKFHLLTTQHQLCGILVRQKDIKIHIHDF